MVRQVVLWEEGASNPYQLVFESQLGSWVQSPWLKHDRPKERRCIRQSRAKTDKTEDGHEQVQKRATATGVRGHLEIQEWCRNQNPSWRKIHGDDRLDLAGGERGKQEQPDGKKNGQRSPSTFHPRV